MSIDYSERHADSKAGTPWNALGDPPLATYSFCSSCVSFLPWTPQSLPLSI
jgi:hypothetical protein